MQCEDESNEFNEKSERNENNESNSNTGYNENNDNVENNVNNAPHVTLWGSRSASPRQLRLPVLHHVIRFVPVL